MRRAYGQRDCLTCGAPVSIAGAAWFQHQRKHWREYEAAESAALAPEIARLEAEQAQAERDQDEYYAYLLEVI